MHYSKYACQSKNDLKLRITEGYCKGRKIFNPHGYAPRERRPTKQPKHPTQDIHVNVENFT